MSKIEEETINIGDLEIFQLGYVYRDIEKHAKIMEEVWGMPKFTFLEENTNEVIYRGKDSTYTTRIAFSRYFGKQIEIIEWISGEGIHKEFLDKGKEGFQHISCMVNGLDDYIESFEKKGIEAAFIGSIGKQHFAYFDTEETLGYIVELQETRKRRRKRK
ncbi:MAG: hypothetical protein GF317_06695 [Candidatus Lokiarchaeota archaeon]|nr:hypothetical protein [Candidatus Lokiarchaeota archaeon]MBD3199403.1 hypothetical protein [Candidatus Lokiarchaeota archaeon]